MSNYATEEHERIVIEYFEETNKFLQNKLYKDKIYPMFQNVFYGVYRKISPKLGYIKHKNKKTLCDEFLSEFHIGFNNFTPSKGKIFSYITRSCFNFLMNENRIQERETKRKEVFKDYQRSYLNGLELYFIGVEPPNPEKEWIREYYFTSLKKKMREQSKDLISHTFLDIFDDCADSKWSSCRYKKVAKRKVYAGIRERLKVETEDISESVGKLKKVLAQHKKEYW